MDLISRDKAIVQLSHNKSGNDDSDVVVQHDIETIKGLPSAFEGKTNGEVIKALFPNMKVHEYTEKVVLRGIGQEFQVWGDAWYAWWNSPYKGVSE